MRTDGGQNSLSRSTAHILRPLPLLALVAAAVRLGIQRARQSRLFAEPEPLGRNGKMKRLLSDSNSRNSNENINIK